MNCGRDGLRGLIYIHTDRGPMKEVWLHLIGRVADPFCGCGGTQNAAHLLALAAQKARNESGRKYGQTRSSGWSSKPSFVSIGSSGELGVERGTQGVEGTDTQAESMYLKQDR